MLLLPLLRAHAQTPGTTPLSVSRLRPIIPTITLTRHRSFSIPHLSHLSIPPTRLRAEAIRQNTTCRKNQCMQHMQHMQHMQQMANTGNTKTWLANGFNIPSTAACIRTRLQRATRLPGNKGQSGARSRWSGTTRQAPHVEAITDVGRQTGCRKRASMSPLRVRSSPLIVTSSPAAPHTTSPAPHPAHCPFLPSPPTRARTWRACGVVQRRYPRSLSPRPATVAELAVADGTKVAATRAEPI
jgi:hypothetical protein